MKKIVVLITLLVLIFTIGKNLLPSNKAFDYHDSTLPARVKEFTLNLKSGQIPPRIAPNFSFNLGYPVFNYYAPTAYWITSGINLLGFDPINSIKISFLITIIIAFLGMYLLANELVSYPAGIIAGTLLASSPWMATQIFIRGDLAEAWFIALFPLTMYLLKKNSDNNGKLLFLITVIITSLLLTSHNLLSLIGSGILLIYILILKKNLLKNFIILILSLTLAGYFFLPALTEMKYTHAIKIATNTTPYSNFLCLKQIWTSIWGYGASVVGCENDGMAFMIGKLMIIFGILGFFWAVKNYKKIKNKPLFICTIFLSLFSIFITLYQSEFLWRLGDPYLNIFQFSWRFLDIAIITLSLIAGYLVFNYKNKLIKAFLIILVILNVFYNAKFFTKELMNLQRFTQDKLSDEFINTTVVYDVPEYLPITASYEDWLEYITSYKIDKYLNKGPVVSKDNLPVTTMKNTYFYKESRILSKGLYILNIHYLSYWNIYIDDELFIPKNFDELGRPLINLKNPTIIKIVYKQTKIEIIGNLITLLTVIGLFVIFVNNNI